MTLEKSLDFRSCFNFVPERYNNSSQLRQTLWDSGFEVGVHGLLHDGKLFRSREIFMERAARINQYLDEWGAVGFYSPSMHRNLDWTHELNIEYDSSTFDTDPFEPEPKGHRTIFPFLVFDNSRKDGYVELPYTIPQDFTVFIILMEKNIDIWKMKLDWIAENGGMALLNTHPDYMNFDGRLHNYEEYPVALYEEFLNYVKSRYEGQYWQALPRQVARFWSDSFARTERSKVVYLPTDTKVREDVYKERPSLIGENKLLSTKQGKKRLWIDLDNSPHVPFFRPIIRELKNRGYDVMITARDCSQVCGLADLFCIEYKKIGRHYGKHRFFKVLGTIGRGFRLALVALKEKPTLALSHGSRAQLLSALFLRIPSVVMMDYEHVKGLLNIRPDYVFIPEVIPDSVFNLNSTRIFKYPGIKEDVYVNEFMPDSSVIRGLGIDEDEILITVRPPATEAHYHNPESEALFEAAIEFICQVPETRIVMLPRNNKQASSIRKSWRHLCESRKIVIPDQVVNGLDLIWYSDLVISGGGTMNRESAALGVPVYSIFRGTIGEVDRYLAENGRLNLIESVEEIRSNIVISKRIKSDEVDFVKRHALQVISDKITELI